MFETKKNYKNDSQLFKYSFLFNVLVIEINLNIRLNPPAKLVGPSYAMQVA